MTIRGVCGHIKASRDNHSNCFSCSSCSRLSACLVCKTRTSDVWDLADKCRLYCLRRSTMSRKRLARKKKVVHSTRDGITTPHGSTAGGRAHIGDIYTDEHVIHSLSPPVTGHQAPVIFTRHLSASHWAPGISHQSYRHQSLSSEHQAPVTGYRSMSVTYQVPVIRQQTLGAEHWVSSF